MSTLLDLLGFLYRRFSVRFFMSHRILLNKYVILFIYEVLSLERPDSKECSGSAIRK